MDNEFDMEKLLKRALESNAKSNKKKSDDINEEKIKSMLQPMMDILGKGALIKLGKASQDKMDKIIEELISDLVNQESADPTKFRSTAVRKIIDAANMLKVLETFLMTTAIVGMSDDDKIDEALETILQLSKW